MRRIAAGCMVDFHRIGCCRSFEHCRSFDCRPVGRSPGFGLGFACVNERVRREHFLEGGEELLFADSAVAILIDGLNRLE